MQIKCIYSMSMLIGCSESDAKRKVYNIKCLHKELDRSHTSTFTACLKCLEQNKHS